MRNLCCALMLASTLLAAQEAPRPVSLAWRRFGADLSGPARPSGYLRVVGRRAALIGWPAGLGGQYVFWDDREKAFVLSESRGQVNGFFGSPSATWATNNPSHMLADAPSELHIAAGGADQMAIAMPKPGEPAGRLTDAHAGGAGIPIVIVGAVAPRDTVRAIYRRGCGAAAARSVAPAAPAQAPPDSTPGVESPHSVLGRPARPAGRKLDQ